MSTHEFDLDLTRPSLGGVYFVGIDDLDHLARRAAHDELEVLRVDLTDCREKESLLQRLAFALALPATFGHNWDALADCLRDVETFSAWGRVLLFAGVNELRESAAADFEILLGVLDDASTFCGEHDIPWFAFLALPDSGFDARRRST